MGQSNNLLISVSKDPTTASALPVSPLPRRCAPQPAGPRPKPTARPRPKPRQRLALLEAIQLEEGSKKEGKREEVKLVDAIKEGQDHLVLRLLQAGVPLDGVDAEGVSLHSLLSWEI